MFLGNIVQDEPLRIDEGEHASANHSFISNKTLGKISYLPRMSGSLFVAALKVELGCSSIERLRLEPNWRRDIRVGSVAQKVSSFQVFKKNI